MKQLLILVALVVINNPCFSQTGIGTKTPKVTLDVSGQATDTSISDGVKVPELTGDQLAAKNLAGAYTADQIGALVYITAPDATPDIDELTENVTSTGHFFFNGTTWNKLGSSVASTSSILYSAEYAGASLSADGSDNLITITANSSGGISLMNFYEASNFETNGGTNDYDIYLRINLPNDFNDFQTNALTIAYDGTTDASFEADVFEQGNAVALQDNDPVDGSGIGAFNIGIISNDTPLANLEAGDTIIVRIKLKVTDVATQGNSIIRIGDVTLNYNRL